VGASVWLELEDELGVGVSGVELEVFGAGFSPG